MAMSSPMHGDSPQEIIRAPAYLAAFRCLGSACEDHCCGGWQGVDIDAPTLELLRRVADPAVKERIALHVIDNADPAASPTERGFIDVARDGGCPFLDVDRLCEIQARLGEVLLPVTCDTFPRLATRVDGVVDLGARPACPEVARLVLLGSDALRIEEVVPDRRLAERGPYWAETLWDDEPEPDDPRRQYHRLRARCVGLLGRRDVPLAMRLRVLGAALRELSGGLYLAAESVEWAFGVAERELRRAARAKVDDADEPVRPATCPDVLRPADRLPEPILERVRVWVAMRDVPARYRRMLDRLRDGLALPVDPNEPPGPRTERAYRDALAAHVRPYLAGRPHLLTNWLLNWVHHTTFPYHPARTFADEATVLACRYATIALHLAGVAAAEGGLSDALAVETVQAFDKYADSPDYWDRALELLHRHDAPRLSALLPDL